MDAALEMLDLLNFKFSDDKSFKRAIEHKMISYEAYGRIINVKGSVLRRTRQLVEEGLIVKFNQAPVYSDDNGAHVYTVKAKPGEFSVRIMGDHKVADCYLVRSAGWLPKGDASAQISGWKDQIQPLEELVGRVASWADKQLPQEQVIREVRHYFATMFYNDKQSFFFGTMTHGGRDIAVKIYLKNYGRLGLQVDMQNK